MELTFERAKASDHDNVIITGKGYGGCVWFFSELLVPFRDRGLGSGSRAESRMKLLPPPPPQPTHLLLRIVEIPPPKSFPHQPLLSTLPPPSSRLPKASPYCCCCFQPGSHPHSIFSWATRALFSSCKSHPASLLLQILPKLDFPIAVVSETGHRKPGSAQDDPPGCGKKG